MRVSATKLNEQANRIVESAVSIGKVRFEWLAGCLCVFVRE